MQGTPRDRTRSRPQVAGSGFRDAGVPCHQVYVEVAGRLTEWGADLSAYPDRGLATSARAPPPPRDALVYQRGYWPFPSCICCGVFFFWSRDAPPPQRLQREGEGFGPKDPDPRGPPAVPPRPAGVRRRLRRRARGPPPPRNSAPGAADPTGRLTGRPVSVKPSHPTELTTKAIPKRFVVDILKLLIG